MLRGFVYVARGLGTGVYKIGHTNRLDARGHRLATEMREGVVILARIHGTYRDEKALHARFAHLRCDHAWHGGTAGVEFFRDRDGEIAAWLESQPADVSRGSLYFPGGKRGRFAGQPTLTDRNPHLDPRPITRAARAA